MKQKKLVGYEIKKQKIYNCPVCKTELKNTLIIDSYTNDKGNMKKRKHFALNCSECNKEY